MPSKPIDTAGIGSLLANKKWAPLDLGGDAAGHLRSKGKAKSGLVRWRKN